MYLIGRETDRKGGQRQTGRGERQKGDIEGDKQGGKTDKGYREGGGGTDRKGGQRGWETDRKGGADREGVGTHCCSSLVASFPVHWWWGAVSVHGCSLSTGAHGESSSSVGGCCVCGCLSSVGSLFGGCCYL